MIPCIGFSLQAQYGLPMDRVIPLLKQAGFSAVSPVWTPELALSELAALANAQGMTLQSLHAPHKHIAMLWEPDSPLSAQVQGNMLRCIDDCARFGIPILVVHGWQGLSYTFPETPLDYRSFDRIVDRAQAQGVSIAFENLEGEEYLQALMDRYRDRPHVGFCWDSGHDHCYPHKLDFLKAFGSRLIMTHLNDNLGLRDPAGIPSGTDDLHLLPMDGNLDWELALGRLKNAPRQSILNFEFKTRSHSSDPRDLIYAGVPPEEFFAEAGRRARSIAEKYADAVL